MSMKQIIVRQYQSIVDNMTPNAHCIKMPPEGWVRTVRKSLGMSGAQLARRLNISRAQVSQTEKNELAGSVTVKTLQQMAEGMGCHFVYAIVPAESTTALLAERARKKAKHLVGETSQHMALEAQTLSAEQIQYEITRLQQQLIAEMPADLWNDD